MKRLCNRRDCCSAGLPQSAKNEREGKANERREIEDEGEILQARNTGKEVSQWPVQDSRKLSGL